MATRNFSCDFDGPDGLREKTFSRHEDHVLRREVELKEKAWHESQKVVEQNDGSVIFEAVVAGTDEIRFWVMGWGSHAEVLEPKTLREQIRAEAETTLSQYGGDSERQEMIGF